MKPLNLPVIARLTVALTLLSGSLAPALAQYKVVAPDGSVTYTDRPQADVRARVSTISRGGAVQPADAALPADLRQLAQRYPVTLYTGNDCAPCESGRRLLQQRGVPYAEKRVSSEDEALLLERAVGGRTLPALTIGTQPLRGYAETDWTAYLDAAGYPRESKLPRNWQPPAAQPLIDKVAPKPAVPSTREPAVLLPEPPTPGAVRF